MANVDYDNNFLRNAHRLQRERDVWQVKAAYAYGEVRDKEALRAALDRLDMNPVLPRKKTATEEVTISHPRKGGKTTALQEEVEQRLKAMGNAVLICADGRHSMHSHVTSGDAKRVAEFMFETPPVKTTPVEFTYSTPRSSAGLLTIWRGK